MMPITVGKLTISTAPADDGRTTVSITNTDNGREKVVYATKDEERAERVAGRQVKVCQTVQELLE